MNIPDLHKLHLFWTVARLGSFTRAAEQLHMTQPTVSQQVAALENQLRTPLIERSTRTLRLTDAGKVLFEYAEKLLPLADEAVNATQVAAGVATQTLKLGVGHTLATYLLPDALSRYRALHPAYRVRLSVGNTAELLDLLVAGDIGVALVGSPAEHPEVQAEPFMHDRLVVIVAPDDSWADRAYIEVEELRERVFLTREPGSALYSSVERLLGAAALADDNVIQLGETEAIKRSVELGLGVALIQGIAIAREVAAGTLKSLPLRGGDDSRTYLVARHARRPLNEAAAEFVDLIKTVAARG
jgi:DNA-binding transcriptional LysR family regulator